MTALQETASWIATGQDEPSWQYGAASGVLEALDGFVIPAVTTTATPTGFAAKSSCPACGTEWVFGGVSQANGTFHLPTADNRGWCRVTTDKNLSSQEVGVIQDDMAFSGACLVDSIRGNAGRSAWVEVLARHKILAPDTQISRVWAWPNASPISPAGLRPTLLAITRHEVVGVVHQPFRQGNKVLAMNQINAVRSLVDALGARWSLKPVVIAVLGNRQQNGTEPPAYSEALATSTRLGIVPLHWQDLLDPVREGSKRAYWIPGDRGDLHPELAGMFENPAGQPFRGCSSFVSELANNMITLGGSSGGGWIACDGCGYTCMLSRLALLPVQPQHLRFAKGARPLKAKQLPQRSTASNRRTMENPVFSDVVAEWSASAEYAQRSLERLLLNIGKISWTLCWPPLHLHPGLSTTGRTTPDALILGEKYVVSVEVKLPAQPHGLLRSNTCRELLVRLAHVKKLTTWLRTKDIYVEPRVLVVGGLHSVPTSLNLANHLLQHFSDNTVYRWNKKGKQVLYGPNDPVCRDIIAGGAEKIADQLLVVSWPQMYTALRDAASDLMIRPETNTTVWQELKERFASPWHPVG